ncbi:hypothetical protein [Paeniglutamicibacter cryotolerans]|uniref:Uncharacterized protein n=1 Tax=Paeniglutamicibacter cryotolerans TaxID=670079 RepID=A0A839QVC9_9MICC|nr:hypothetical protein [Paeniglutamicibacter cryotolerans]MBB2997252.1 hypothetical protein [Paeniglutamicibacter cryotolerans]
MSAPILAAKAAMLEAGAAIHAAAAQGPQAVQAAQEKWAPAMAQAQIVLQHAQAAVDTLATNTAIASYVAAFWWGAALFAAGSVATVLLLRSAIPAALKYGPGADPATEKIPDPGTEDTTGGSGPAAK